MQQIQTILVGHDSDYLQKLKRDLQHYCPRLHVVGSAGISAETITLITTMKPDLVFLEANESDDVILDMLSRTKEFSLPVVTFGKTSLNIAGNAVFDYLSKPADVNDILHCYDKIICYFGSGFQSKHLQAGIASPAKVILRQGDRVYIVEMARIVILKAQGFYTCVQFEHDGSLKEIVISKPINVLHREWGTELLIRVHRSYAVNMKKVSAVRKMGAGLALQVNQMAIPVAKRRVQEFYNQFHD